MIKLRGIEWGRAVWNHNVGHVSWIVMRVEEAVQMCAWLGKIHNLIENMIYWECVLLRMCFLQVQVEIRVGWNFENRQFNWFWKRPVVHHETGGWSEHYCRKPSSASAFTVMLKSSTVSSNLYSSSSSTPRPSTASMRWSLSSSMRMKGCW